MFDCLAEVVEKINPVLIVVVSLPSRLQSTAAELAKKGIIFLRLKKLEKLAEERENNGIHTTNRNL